MKTVTFLSFVTGLLFLASCASSETVRRPVPPLGSDKSDMPWNTPQAGEGGGAFGGLLNRQ